MRYEFLVLLLLAISICSAKEFIGTATIKEVAPAFSPSEYFNPAEDKMSICTDQVKYRLKPGDTIHFLMYLMNPMDERPYTDITISMPSDLFIINLSETHIDYLAPQEVRTINVTVTAPADLPTDKYTVNFNVKTHDYYEEGFIRSKVFVVVNIWEYEHEAFVAIMSVIVFLLSLRFIRIQLVNRRYKKSRHA